MTELQFCRDVYHCTPTELAEVDGVTILRHMAVLRAESTVQDARRRRQAAMSKRRK